MNELKKFQKNILIIYDDLNFSFNDLKYYLSLFDKLLRLFLGNEQSVDNSKDQISLPIIEQTAISILSMISDDDKIKSKDKFFMSCQIANDLGINYKCSKIIINKCIENKRFQVVLYRIIRNISLYFDMKIDLDFLRLIISNM